MPVEDVRGLRRNQSVSSGWFAKLNVPRYSGFLSASPYFARHVSDSYRDVNSYTDTVADSSFTFASFSQYLTEEEIESYVWFAEDIAEEWLEPRDYFFFVGEEGPQGYLPAYWGSMPSYGGPHPFIRPASDEDLFEPEQSYVSLVTYLPFRTRLPTKLIFFQEWRHLPATVACTGEEFNVYHTAITKEPRPLSEHGQSYVVRAARHLDDSIYFERFVEDLFTNAIIFSKTSALCLFFGESSLGILDDVDPFEGFISVCHPGIFFLDFEDERIPKREGPYRGMIFHRSAQDIRYALMDAEVLPEYIPLEPTP